jgi:hypothetical protein
MLLTFTDVTTQKSIAINPQQVNLVFTAEDETLGKEVTVINLANGNVAVSEDYSTVFGSIQSELK